MIIVLLSCIVLTLSPRRRERVMEVPVESEPTFVPFTCVFFAQHSFRVRNTDVCGSHHFIHATINWFFIRS